MKPSALIRLNVCLAAVTLFTAISSCCFGDYKCKGNDLDARILIQSLSGENLFFGSNPRYRLSQLRFFNLNGLDTVFHHYVTAPGNNTGDSLLQVYFDHRKFETVYLQMQSGDIDTLLLRYREVDASPCCPDYTMVSPSQFNQRPVLEGSGAFFTLIK